MFTDKNGDLSFKKIAGTVALGVAGVVGVAAAVDSVVIVDQTERGIDYRMGKMTTTDGKDLRQPGFSLKTPFLTSVKKVRLDKQDVLYEKQETFTKDNQTIHGDLAVTFRIPEGNIVSIYKNNPNYESILKNTVLNATKTMFGQQEAQNVAQNRGDIVKKITEETQKEVGALLGIEVIKVQLPNFDFDEQFRRAVADAANAKAVLNQKQTELEQQRVEKDKAIVNAEARAGEQKAKSDADAYSTQRAAEAEIKAAEAQATAAKSQAEAQLTLASSEAGSLAKIRAAVGPQNMGTWLTTKVWKGDVPQVVAGGGASAPIVIPVPSLR
jgi:regulator of protease activity HflC (stomatin/prohibitin superfamily)